MNKLSEYCINITDGEHGTVIDDLSGEYFLLSNKNIIDGKIEITSDDRIISKESYEKINKRCKLEDGDVVISTVGTLGKTAVLNGNINYSFQRSVGIIKTDKNKLNPYFLKYQLDTPSYQKRLVNLSKGAIQKCLFIDDISNLEFDVPSVDLQNHIVTILMNCDSKIANNNLINSELESLAKTIYDYWFLQFEFPNEEGKPYKSSGGKMVWNDILKREIPEGWEVKKYCEISTTATGKEDANFATANGKYAFFTCGSDVLKCDEFKFDGKAILIAGNGDFNVKYYNGQFNAYQRTYVLMPNEKYIGILYQASLRKINQFKSGSNGSIVKFITKGDIDGIELIIPDKEGMLKLFNTILDIIQHNNRQNQELASLRDFLLPMLMNGQVAFKEKDA